MSVHAITTAKTGTAYEVRWRALDGSNRARRFADPDDADAFDTAVRARVALDRAQARWADVPRRLRAEVGSAA